MGRCTLKLVIEIQADRLVGVRATEASDPVKTSFEYP